MSYIPISIAAYFLNGLSVLSSKLLLTKRIPHPISFVFYISVSSLVALVALPWTHLLSINTFWVASLSTLAWTLGAYFLFSALKIGLASRVAPIIGTLTPVFLIIYYYAYSHSISLNETWGALISTLGLLIIIIPYLRDHLRVIDSNNRTSEIIYEILAAFLFAVSYILLKEVYNHTDFLTGLVWSRFILIPLALIIVAIPFLRRMVFSSEVDKVNFLSKTGLIFIFSQVSGGVSQATITFAISIANPALVNSLQGVQYAFLFIASLFLTQKYPRIFDENLTKKVIIQRTIGILVVAFGLYILSFANTTLKETTTLGISYSPRYASSLGLNPKITYVEALDDLNPKTVRLPIYWDEVEPTQGKFDFSKSDYYIKVAEQRNIKLSLVVGLKVPRYPECYTPKWVGKDISSLNSSLYKELEVIVKHYKESPSLETWQVENEPLFPFGVCPKADYSRLQTEVKLVKGLDSKHPVMVTESGEFGLWLTTANLSDIVGTTLYRRTLSPYADWFKSPLPPFFYQFKGMIVKAIYPQRKIYVSELQAEPWATTPLTKTNIDYQTASFPLEDLSDNVKFAKEAGFDTVYLWGTEWWYYLKFLGHPEYVNEAIMIFKDIN